MSEIPEKILNSIDNYDVISFDIYDTIILRPYLNSNDRFLHIEKVLGFKDFAKKRVKAEYLARQQIIDDEIQFDHIYQLLERKYQKAYNYELELEIRSCQKNQEIYSIYNYALKQNKKIVFIEDIYLPYSMIENLLKKTGYTIYEYLFVSSYYKKTKASGGLFEELIYTLSVDPENVLHIGDDRQADYEVPKKIGINAILYHKVKDRFFEEYPNLCSLTERENTRRFQIDPYRFKVDSLNISLIYGINILLWLDYNNKSYWYRFGHIYAAPLLYAFTQWVYNTAKNRGVKDIAFVARDGYNPIKIFKLFDNKKEFNAHYIYLPRYISRTCHFQEEKDILFYFERYDRSNVDLMLQDFSKTNDRVKEAYSEFIKANPTPTLRQIQNFILNNKSLFFEEAAIRRSYVLNYLKGMELLANDLIVVDFSTRNASSQKILQRIIDENELPIKLYGFYYILQFPIPSSLLWEAMTPETGMKYTTERFALLEYLVSSPENPILSLKKVGESYEPVYQSMEGDSNEAFRIDSYIEISEGIMDFARRTYNVFGGMSAIDDVDTITRHINNLINNPSKRDIDYLKQAYYSFGHDDNYIPLLGHKSINRIIFVNKLRRRIPKNIRVAFRYLINIYEGIIYNFRLGK